VYPWAGLWRLICQGCDVHLRQRYGRPVHAEAKDSSESARVNPRPKVEPACSLVRRIVARRANRCADGRVDVSAGSVWPGWPACDIPRREADSWARLGRAGRRDRCRHSYVLRFALCTGAYSASAGVAVVLAAVLLWFALGWIGRPRCQKMLGGKYASPSVAEKPSAELVIDALIAAVPGIVEKNRDEIRIHAPACREVHKGHVFGAPKTKAGESRVLELDGGAAGVLLAHRLDQDGERAAWGEAYSDHDLIFAREDGRPLPLDHVTKRFRELAVAAGVCPVRLHDLRQGAASLMLAAGVNIALVSKRLGHSSISITNDTYSHMLEGVGREAPERAAALVPRNRGAHSVPSEPKSAGPMIGEKVSFTGQRRFQVVRRQGLEPRTRWSGDGCCTMIC
jgi:hypothetical protein